MQGTELGEGGAGARPSSPRCALRAQGLKARNLIHARIEENIRAKICGLRAAEAGAGYKDALQLLIEHSWERGERLDMQVSGSPSRSPAAACGLLVSQVRLLGPPKRWPGAQLPAVGSLPAPPR